MANHATHPTAQYLKGASLTAATHRLADAATPSQANAMYEAKAGTRYDRTRAPTGWSNNAARRTRYLLRAARKGSGGVSLKIALGA